MPPRRSERTRIGLGGGCHWCTEAVFQSLRSVERVEQGWFSADPPHDAWSEGAQVSFDAAALPLSVLLDVHLRTHASTSAHSLRGKYRSAVYVEDGEMAARVGMALDGLQGGCDAPLVTQVLRARGFRASSPAYLNYYRTDPDRPFCRTYIDPKLAMLRQEFGEVVKEP